ncbi:MAG: energy-coupling factor ABC transporter ATP-binding protein [Clostridiales Family XIII bacterium]|jgi:energy-coupling factor transport system ATP-binding protein|nr:energy-coupling factor ABC transporter ATP-binding protein [Clostridiales Family XIII bacterium]
MALEVKNLTFSYARNPSRKRRDFSPVFAVNDFSAVFERGKITAVMGPNGCGKTTLSKLLVGILKPLRGGVFLDGENLSGRRLAEIGKQIGLVAQQPDRQLFCTSVSDEMEFGLKCLELDSAEIEARKARYLEYFDLERYAETFPFELSTGEKQRLVIAAVIAMKPAYLILDEPTSALDRGRKAALGALLRGLASDEHTGVVLFSHDESFTARYADGVIKMEEGQTG